ASYLVNYLLHESGPEAWRWMFYTGVLPALVYLLVLAYVPESPRHLIRIGRIPQARRILARIGGADADVTVSEIEASLRADTGRWRDLLGPRLRAPLRLSILLAILIHLCGINTIIEYAPAIFTSAGFTLDAALFSTFVVGIANFAFTLVSFWVIDRVGRRPLYIVGSAGMGLCLFCLAGAALIGQFQGMTVLVLIVAYLFFFAACIGPVFWTLLPEIFPNGLRAKALTIPVLTQWVANALVVLFFPAIFHAIGEAATFGLLAFACLLQALVAVRALPETRNRSLEDIAAGWIRPGPV
ncbi:MAG: MFS transporter, partial [Hyphomonas sp.]|uniref:MFS transporter n=1 Tax=Hyphomonas sp. TaxID=87 RepID=UPI0034A03CF1